MRGVSALFYNLAAFVVHHIRVDFIPRKRVLGNEGIGTRGVNYHDGNNGKNRSDDNTCQEFHVFLYRNIMGTTLNGLSPLAVISADVTPAVRLLNKTNLCQQYVNSRGK